MTSDDLVALARTLPEVEVSTSFGTPALKVRGKLLTRLRPEDDSLVLPDVPVEEREMLIAADPGVFHVTPHYDGVHHRVGPDWRPESGKFDAVPEAPMACCRAKAAGGWLRCTLKCAA
ncbi:hypothetical protein [uncultured Enterovirga sp.]|uniref:hypothetical protein n=1 Tax=uncultured Enterovirga sp. TaxID=2026352 RepID=UPI0035CA7B4C